MCGRSKLRCKLLPAALFAAILGDGSVATWGDAEYGGDSSAGAGSAEECCLQIQATCSAFAAILGDGSIVTWGDAKNGGDSSAVQAQLKECTADPGHSQRVCCRSWRWFRPWTWGSHRHGGDSRDVQHQLQNVQKIQACDFAFCRYICRRMRCDLGSLRLWW